LIKIYEKLPVRNVLMSPKHVGRLNAIVMT
jgi:hypothetical protein